MYAGQIVEQAPVSELFKNPKHPYTAGLLRCVPKPATESGTVTKLSRIPGSVFPSSEPTPESCLFASRCPMAQESCHMATPQVDDVAEGHNVLCTFWKDVKPEIWGDQEPAVLTSEKGTETVISAEGLRRFYGRWQRKYMLFGPRVRPPVRAATPP